MLGEWSLENGCVPARETLDTDSDVEMLMDGPPESSAESDGASRRPGDAFLFDDETPYFLRGGSLSRENSLKRSARHSVHKERRPSIGSATSNPVAPCTSDAFPLVAALTNAAKSTARRHSTQPVSSTPRTRNAAVRAHAVVDRIPSNASSSSVASSLLQSSASPARAIAPATPKLLSPSPNEAATRRRYAQLRQSALASIFNRETRARVLQRMLPLDLQRDTANEDKDDIVDLPVSDAEGDADASSVEDEGEPLSPTKSPRGRRHVPSSSRRRSSSASVMESGAAADELKMFADVDLDCMAVGDAARQRRYTPVRRHSDKRERRLSQLKEMKQQLLTLPGNDSDEEIASLVDHTSLDEVVRRMRNLPIADQNSYNNNSDNAEEGGVGQVEVGALEILKDEDDVEESELASIPRVLSPERQQVLSQLLCSTLMNRRYAYVRWRQARRLGEPLVVEAVSVPTAGLSSLAEPQPCRSTEGPTTTPSLMPSNQGLLSSEHDDWGLASVLSVPSMTALSGLDGVVPPVSFQGDAVPPSQVLSPVSQQDVLRYASPAGVFSQSASAFVDEEGFDDEGLDDWYRELEVEHKARGLGDWFHDNGDDAMRETDSFQLASASQHRRLGSSKSDMTGHFREKVSHKRSLTVRMRTSLSPSKSSSKGAFPEHLAQLSNAVPLPLDIATTMHMVKKNTQAAAAADKKRQEEVKSSESEKAAAATAARDQQRTRMPPSIKTTLFGTRRAEAKRTLSLEPTKSVRVVDPLGKKHASHTKKIISSPNMTRAHTITPREPTPDEHQVGAHQSDFTSVVPSPKDSSSVQMGRSKSAGTMHMLGLKPSITSPEQVAHKTPTQQHVSLEALEKSLTDNEARARSDHVAMRVNVSSHEPILPRPRSTAMKRKKRAATIRKPEPSEIIARFRSMSPSSIQKTKFPVLKDIEAVADATSGVSGVSSEECGVDIEEGKTAEVKLAVAVDESDFVDDVLAALPKELQKTYRRLSKPPPSGEESAV